MSQELLQALEEQPVAAIEPRYDMAKEVLKSMLRKEVFRLSWGKSSPPKSITKKIKDPFPEDTATLVTVLENNKPIIRKKDTPDILEIVETYICLKILSNLGILKSHRNTETTEEDKEFQNQDLEVIENFFLQNERREVLSRVLSILEVKMKNGGPIAELVKQETHEDHPEAA